MKRKTNCGKLPVELSLLGLWNMAKAPRKSEFHTLLRSFNNSPDERWTSCPTSVFRCQVITSINLEDSYTTNTLDGSALADKLITNHQVDYLSSAFIQHEAVEKEQEHPVTIRYSITSFV